MFIDINAYIHWKFILLTADGNMYVYLCCLYDMIWGKQDEKYVPTYFVINVFWFRTMTYVLSWNDIEHIFSNQHDLDFFSCRRPWPNRPELCILSKMLYRLLLPNLAEVPGLSPVISAWHVIWHYRYSMHHSKHCLFSRWTSWNEWGSEVCSWYWK